MSFNAIKSSMSPIQSTETSSKRYLHGDSQHNVFFIFNVIMTTCVSKQLSFPSLLRKGSPCSRLDVKFIDEHGNPTDLHDTHAWRLEDQYAAIFQGRFLNWFLTGLGRDWIKILYDFYDLITVIFFFGCLSGLNISNYRINIKPYPSIWDLKKNGSI